MIKTLHVCVLLALQIEWMLKWNSVVWYASVSVNMMMCMQLMERARNWSLICEISSDS